MGHIKGFLLPLPSFSSSFPLPLLYSPSLLWIFFYSVSSSSSFLLHLPFFYLILLLSWFRTELTSQLCPLLISSFACHHGSPVWMTLEYQKKTWKSMNTSKCIWEPKLPISAFTSSSSSNNGNLTCLLMCFYSCDTDEISDLMFAL